VAMSFQSEDSLFDSTVGTYELDANGNPTNLRALIGKTREATPGDQLGQFGEPPRVFMIRGAGAFASDPNAVLEWNGSTGVTSNGSGVPLLVFWTDVRFNYDNRPHVLYTDTADGVTIGLEDIGDDTFDDVVLKYTSN